MRIGIFSLIVACVCGLAAGQAQLIPPGGNTLPLWAPDGKSLLYLQVAETQNRFAPRHHPRRYHFATRSSDDVIQRALPERTDVGLRGSDTFLHYASWAPDGGAILFYLTQPDMAAINQSLYEYDTGRFIPFITSRPREYAVSAAWSPDSKSLALITDWQTGSLSVMNRNSRTRRDLPVSGCYDTPVWTPDGSNLIVAIADGQAGVRNNPPADLWLISAKDGTKIRNLTNTPDSSERLPSLSPDGTLLAYVKVPAGDRGVNTGNAAVMLSPLTPFLPVQFAAHATFPRWRPDSKALVTCTATDRPERPIKQTLTLKVIDLKGKVLKEIQAVQGSDNIPVTLSFNPDSRRFVYDNGGAIYLDTL